MHIYIFIDNTYTHDTYMNIFKYNLLYNYACRHSYLLYGLYKLHVHHKTWTIHSHGRWHKRCQCQNAEPPHGQQDWLRRVAWSPVTGEQGSNGTAELERYSRRRYLDVQLELLL